MELSRTRMSNQACVDEWFIFLDGVLQKYGIKDMPDRVSLTLNLSIKYFMNIHSSFIRYIVLELNVILTIDSKKIFEYIRYLLTFRFTTAMKLVGLGKSQRKLKSQGGKVGIC
jgi:hypothetical protein